MLLYHGSYMIIDKPVIIKTEYDRDFGFGFYTTDIKEQAIRWAIRKAKLLHWPSSFLRPLFEEKRMALWRSNDYCFISLRIHVRSGHMLPRDREPE